MDANTYFINRHLAEIDDRIAAEEANWPVCERCEEKIDPDFFCFENDLCDECNMPDVAELERLRAVYEGEKSAGLHGEFTDEGLKMRAREMRGGN